MSVLPIIDLGAAEPDLPELAALGRQIGIACRDVGFFYVRTRAVPESLRTEVFAEAHRFFDLDAAAKDSVAIRRSANNRGYVGVAVEALDPARGPDRKEAFNIGLDLAADDPEVRAERPFRGINLWPDLLGFRAVMMTYYDAMLALGVTLHQAIAVELGLPREYFNTHLDRPLATLRLLHYPPPLAEEGGTLGAGQHTDYGNLTLLMTDEAGGLEVRRRDGSWLAVPSVPGAFVCNVGDCLMRWTNDVFTSTPHRVRNPVGRERYSVAFFLDANPDALVDCLPTCKNADRPALYPPITAGDYLRSRLDATYAPRQPGN